MNSKNTDNINKKESFNSPAELICINCPAGCRLTAVQCGDDWDVTGNRCARGSQYAKQELTDPRRVLTALMRVAGGKRPISVKTDRGVPKSLLMECAREIYRTHPEAPVHAGDIRIENVCGTGCRVIATRDSE